MGRELCRCLHWPIVFFVSCEFFSSQTLLELGVHLNKLFELVVVVTEIESKFLPQGKPCGYFLSLNLIQRSRRVLPTLGFHLGQMYMHSLSLK